MNRILSNRLTRLLLVALVPAIVLGVFVAALAAADSGTARVPAALVNNDEIVQMQNADGTESPVAAGRLVVSGLTAPADPDTGASIDWRLSNDEQAADLLARGEVYAIVTIPKGFSAAITSLGGDDPRRADIRISTDDAHGTLVSRLGPLVGDAIASNVGSQISANVVSGLYGGYGSVRTSLLDAADGADALGDGVADLADGLDASAAGQERLASGARQLSGGATQLAGGADRLAGGLDSVAGGAQAAASGARRIADGIDTYTDAAGELGDGVTSLLSQASGALDGVTLADLPATIGDAAEGAAASKRAVVDVLAAEELSPHAREQLRGVLGDLERMEAMSGTAAAVEAKVAGVRDDAGRLAAAAAALESGSASVSDRLDGVAAGVQTALAGADRLSTAADSLADGVDGIAGGVAAAGDGARRLGTGASGIASGADGLATGNDRLAAGLRRSADGGDDLASGVRELGAGLRTGVEQVPDLTAAEQRRVSRIVADPIDTTVSTDHELAGPGEIVATLIIPVGLWIGAAALVLLLGAVQARLLATGIGTGRLVGSALLRSVVVALVQALLIVVLLQSTLAVPWSRVAPAFLVAVVAGVAFLAIHQALQAGLGRAGTVLSIVLLGVQLVAVGGIYPIELVAAPFQAISPFLPLTAAVSATQAVLAGASGATVAAGLASLVVWGLLAFAATVLIVARGRTTRALLAPPHPART